MVLQNMKEKLNLRLRLEYSFIVSALGAPIILGAYTPGQNALEKDLFF